MHAALRMEPAEQRVEGMQAAQRSAPHELFMGWLAPLPMNIHGPPV